MSSDGSCLSCPDNMWNVDQEGFCECKDGYEPDPGEFKHFFQKKTVLFYDIY